MLVSRKMWRVLFSGNNHLILTLLSFFQRNESCFLNVQLDDSIKTSCGNAESFGKTNFEFYLI